MKTMYRTSGFLSATIAAVCVVKETTHFLTLQETDERGKTHQWRAARSSGYHNYFDTWEEAREHLRTKALRVHERAEKSLADAKRQVAEVEAMVKP